MMMHFGLSTSPLDSAPYPTPEIWRRPERARQNEPVRPANTATESTESHHSDLQFATALQTATLPDSLNQHVSEAIKRQLATLEDLPDGWDGYGARRLLKSTLNQMSDALNQALAGVDCPPPDLIPGGDGSIQAEWHLNKIVLFFKLGLDGSRYLYVEDRQQGSEYEYFGGDAFDAFQKWAPSLTTTRSIYNLAA